MNKTRIQKIENDIAVYREAIENAEGALQEAERELREELDQQFVNDVDIEDYPEYNRD